MSKEQTLEILNDLINNYNLKPPLVDRIMDRIIQFELLKNKK